MYRFSIILLCALLTGVSVYADGNTPSLQKQLVADGQLDKDDRKDRGKSNSNNTLNSNGPAILDVKRLNESAFPNADEMVELSFRLEATILDIDRNSVALEYRVNNGKWHTVWARSMNGRNFSASIPPQAPGSLVEYRIIALDVEQNAGVDAERASRYYRVLRGKAKISDIREPFYSDGASAYVGKTANIEGIVTAVLSDPNGSQTLRIFVQESQAQEYGGIMIISSVETLGFAPAIGDLLQLEGRIHEVDGGTALTNIKSAQVLARRQEVVATPVNLMELGRTLPNGQTAHEQWENMLVEVHYVCFVEHEAAKPEEGLVFIAPEHNADAPEYFLPIDVRHSPYWRNAVAAGIGHSSNPAVNKPFETIRGSLVGTAEYAQLVPRKDDDFGTLVTSMDELFSYNNSFNSYPNPAAGICSFVFELPKAAFVEMQIFDQQGRVLATPVRTYFPSGRSVAHFPVSDLTNGVYYGVLKTDSGHSLHHCFVVRQ